jgi:alcohol dehydrogenase
LQVLADLLASGELRSEIDRRYPLSAVAEAVAYLESGRARGKVIIEVSTPPTQVPDPATL